jgi:GH3 auxin-responsive promoter
MNPFYAPLLYRLWLRYCKKEWHHFDCAAGNVESQQKSILFNYLKQNSKTVYGRRYDFKNITSIAQYQQSLPLTTYDDYQEEISDIARGKHQILTKDKVRLFEPSSGSTCSSKLIPYTSTLKKEFHRGINAWIYNLYSNYPALKGIAYWSLSPASTYTPPDSCVVPVGFEADSEYLGFLGKFANNLTQAVPAEVARIADIESFRYVTLLCLLKHRDLRLISVWNPTFLSLLMDSLPNHWHSLITDLAAGTISPPGPLDKNLLIKLRRKISPALERAEELKKHGPLNPQRIWPNLGLISCWQDGSSDGYAAELQKKHFPQVVQQGKGLISTEAFVSFPIVGRQGCVLAGSSHFFEFIPQNSFGNPKAESIRLAHELKTGRLYSVVVTTGGGLYRYQLQDIVEVTDHYKELPCFRFIGKIDGISDIYGEKLNPQFVEEELFCLFAEMELSPCFSLLCPNRDLSRYVLYLEDSTLNKAISSSLATELDRRLCKNFHYAYCRKLGQLKGVQVFCTEPGAAGKYFDHCKSRGMKLGDIKACVLSKTPLDQRLFS